VGLQEGMKMILTGSVLRPDKAKKLGLVDLVVDSASLESVAISQVLLQENSNRIKKNL
jgi:enoyl-CoA hydratase/long-chain 3-hydroxyacyl-CoA dehydrogenase